MSDLPEAANVKVSACLYQFKISAPYFTSVLYNLTLTLLLSPREDTEDFQDSVYTAFTWLNMHFLQHAYRKAVQNEYVIQAVKYNY